MITSNNYSEWTYVGGRIVAMASRPLMLLAINHWGGNEPAAAVAVIFLATMLAAAISNFDAHRLFYQSYFGKDSLKGIKDCYQTFYSSIMIQIFTVSIILILFIAFKFDDILLSIAVAIYFSYERFADESQRFLIFAARRQEWGQRILIKAVLQLLGVVFAVTFFDRYHVHFIIIFLIIGNHFAYAKKFNKNYINISCLNIKKSTKLIFDQRIFVVMSILSSCVGYADRIVVMLFKQSDMAIYTIMVSSASIIQNAVEYFYLSLKRKEILRGNISLLNVLSSKNFYKIIIYSSALSFVLCIIMLYVYFGQNIINLILVPIVVSCQLFLAITLVAREIVYWSSAVKSIIIIDLFFCFGAISISNIIYYADLDYLYAVSAICILLLIRLSSMVLMSSKLLGVK